MPNWCRNYVTITHTEKEMIDKIENAIKSEEGFMQSFYPMPEELVGTTAPSESGLDWYFWRTSNWGTKWDVDIDEHDRLGDTEIQLFFDSAWSPPSGFYQYIAEKFDYEIDAEFNEEGVGFIGYWNTEEGEESWEYYDIFEKHGDRWSEHIPERFHDMLECNYESWKEWREDEDMPDPKTDKSVS
jgi:hypothetical protein